MVPQWSAVGAVPLQELQGRVQPGSTGQSTAVPIFSQNLPSLGADEAQLLLLISPEPAVRELLPRPPFSPRRGPGNSKMP